MLIIFIFLFSASTNIFIYKYILAFNYLRFTILNNLKIVRGNFFDLYVIKVIPFLKILIISTVILLSLFLSAKYC